MKKLLVSILALWIVPAAAAQISVGVYETDGETPLEGNDIMVGTNAMIVISSDSNDYWSGGLFLTGQERAFATLAGKDLDPNTRDWTGSHLEEVGDFAKVTEWKDSSMWGFDLYTFYPVDGNSDNNSTGAGDWFIIDYKAEDVGDCNLGFYDYSISWDDPNYCISFSHVPTRDLNSDEVVNFGDFAIFASQWNATDCNDPNWCDGADLDMDGDVDSNDLGLFPEYWLWGALDTEPGEEPNVPEDPNVTYSIVDANGNAEITMDIGSSITLYVDMETNEPNYVSSFDIEINISDTNLGSIDNRGYDPTDPNASTARILVEPDNSLMKGWRPGSNQEEGIRFFYLTFGSPISDGHLASFVFTCEGEGDVALELINWSSSGPSAGELFPKRQNILIHQVDPNSEEMMGGEMGGMLGMQEAQEPQQVQEIDIDEMVRFLEEVLLQNDTIRDTIDDDELERFIDSLMSSAQQLQ